MNSKMLAGVYITVAILAGQEALADSWKHDRGERRFRDASWDYARVVDVDPIIERTRISVPQRQCYRETRYDYAEYTERYTETRHAPAAGQMILGGVIGAALGNQIGSGDGRRAATVAGALIGSAIGHDVAGRRAARADERYAPERVARNVERCETHYVDDYEERIEGYHVTYVYNGRRMSTRLPYDPGDRIRVRVDVRPDDRY